MKRLYWGALRLCQRRSDKTKESELKRQLKVNMSQPVLQGNELRAKCSLIFSQSRGSEFPSNFQLLISKHFRCTTPKVNRNLGWPSQNYVSFASAQTINPFHGRDFDLSKQEKLWLNPFRWASSSSLVSCMLTHWHDGLGHFREWSHRYYYWLHLCYSCFDMSKCLPGKQLLR